MAEEGARDEGWWPRGRGRQYYRVTADIDSWLGGGCRGSWTVPFRSAPFCSVLLAFTSIHRVSSINVCALLYCPSTPTTRHNPPAPSPRPFPSRLSQHLVTFYLILFYSFSIWLCVQSTSIVGALMAIHPIQVHDNDIHIMMRLSVPFHWHFRDAIKLFDSSVVE